MYDIMLALTSKARIGHHSWLTGGSDERELGQQSEWFAECKQSRHQFKTGGVGGWLGKKLSLFGDGRGAREYMSVCMYDVALTCVCMHL